MLGCSFLCVLFTCASDFFNHLRWSRRLHGGLNKSKSWKAGRAYPLWVHSLKLCVHWAHSYGHNGFPGFIILWFAFIVHCHGTIPKISSYLRTFWIMCCSALGVPFPRILCEHEVIRVKSPWAPKTFYMNSTWKHLLGASVVARNKRISFHTPADGKSSSPLHCFD